MLWCEIATRVEEWGPLVRKSNCFNSVLCVNRSKGRGSQQRCEMAHIGESSSEGNEIGRLEHVDL